MSFDDHGDDGDDGPGSGPLPDPSERHWRHPSELRRQHALPQPTPEPAAMGATSSGLWPALAVGGVLTLAVIGVLGFQAGVRSRAPAGTAAGGPPVPDDVSEAAAETRVPEVGGDPEPTSTTAPPAATTIATTAASTSAPEAAVRSSWPDPSTSVDLANQRPVAANAPVYGLFDAPGDDGRRLGSFVATAEVVVTSATAVGDRRVVWLRVGPDWMEAAVVGVDSLTDVALLDPIGADDALPWLAPGSAPTEPGRPVMIGYGDPTAELGADDAGPRSDDPGPELEPTGGLQGGRPVDGEADPTPADDPDQPDGLADEAAEPLPEGAVDGGTQPVGDEPVTTSTAVDDEAWVLAGERRGWIYSNGVALVTATNRIVDHSIMVAVDPRAGDAGSPLRNRDGEVVGVIVPSKKALVSAVPIDLVLSAASSIERYGAGDPAWLGVEVIPATDGRGLVVAAVDEISGAELVAGDLIVAIDDQPARHPDALGFAARRAGPGGRIDLTFDRDGRRWTISVDVATHPAMR